MSLITKQLISAEIETVELVLEFARQYPTREELIAAIIEYRGTLEKDLVEASEEP